MKIIKPLLIISSILLSQASFANDDHEAGEKLFKANCAVCHGTAVGGMDMSKRIAPPIAAVRMHYIDTYPDEASFVAAVSSWVEKQDESKSLMRGAINKFKIMPPLAVSKEDAAKIAAYIYGGNIEKPEGFEKHVEEEHGKNGKGKMHSEGMHEQGSEMHNMKGMHEQGGGMHNMEGMHKQDGGMQNMEEMHKKMQGQHQGKGMGMRGQGNGMRQMMQGRGMQGQQQRMMNMRQRMQGKMHRGNGKRGMSAQMMQQLNLSSSQQQQMQSLIQEKQSRLQPVKKEMYQINQAIRQLDTTSPNYKSQIFSLADEKAKRIHRMVIERGEMRMKIEAVLNLEQRKQFNQLRQQHNNNH